MNRRSLLAATAAGLAAPGLVHAQAVWPADRPIRVIVPWPPGGSTDVLVRLYAEKLQQVLGQSIVIDNRAGAGGNIGIDATAKAAPDGYTLGIASIGHLAINQYLYARLPYDPEKDLLPVGIAWDLPNIAVVASAHNASKTLAEFITWAKAKPDGVTYGSPGVGTTPHLSAALFCARVGIQGIHVPFRGAAQTIPTMLSGDVDFALDNLASYMPTIQAGQMRGLAVTSADRWANLPDVPTMGEAGVPDFVVTSWQGFVLPARTPAEIVSRLGEALHKVATDPAFKDRLLRTGAEAVWSTPQDMAARAARERPMWQEAVRISGARVE
ncbi:tripartite-type tricarboxylate transporter receptor subunit TctC [Humitalea rosea]|uniref:Tripartite-type tricarboxylate transporter receptor subunit TctC n=1 Tax=Humitalea rosea TaxID=990373 RepID=A0A2W7IPY6_9PROT|nr:tripartite tricarboxylate transporter substrate binding protein [Humitalea rosea]PZW48154.1 tripartite-type tricarboxylate transporter receptor subunit TctC [Humitalea rosea]